jgi:hypothetical protein
LGLIVDPKRDNLPFSFSVEILEPNHGTLMDVNPGFQLFYVLKGSGQAFCLDRYFPGNNFKALMKRVGEENLCQTSDNLKVCPASMAIRLRSFKP